MEKNSNIGMNTAYNQLGLLADASSLPGQIISWHCPLNMENKKDNPADYDSDETYYDAGGGNMRPNSLSVPDTAGQFVSNNVPDLLQAQKTKSSPTMEGVTIRPRPIPVSTEINETDDTGSDLDQFVNEVLPSILGDFGDFDLNDGQDNQWDDSNEFMPHSQFIDNNRWTDSNFDNEINKLTSQVTLDHFLNSEESYDELIATNVTNDDTLVDLFNVSASQHHNYSISQENRNAIDNACFRAVAERSRPNKKPANVSHSNSIGKRMETIRALLKGKKPVEKLKCPKELTIQLRSRENTTLKGVSKTVLQTVKNMTVKSISTKKDSQARVNNSDGGNLMATRLEKLRKSHKENKPSKPNYKNKVQSSKPQMKKHQRASKRTSQTYTTRRPAQSILTELNKMRDEVSEIQDDVRTSLFHYGTPLTGLKADEYLTHLHRHLERLDTIKKGPKDLIDEIRHVIGQLVCTLNKCLDDMKLVSTEGAKESCLWQNETIFEESEISSQSSDKSENSDQGVPVDSASDDICLINDAFECISITSSPVPSVTGDNQFEGQESFDMFQTYEEPTVNEELNRTNESQGDSTYFTQSQKEPDTSNVQIRPTVWTQKLKTSQENNDMDTRMLLEQPTPMEITQTEEENHSVRKPCSVSATEMGAQKQPMQTQTIAMTQPEYSNVIITKRKPFYDFNIGRMRAVSNDEILELEDTRSSLHSSVDFIDDTQMIDLTGDNEPDDKNNKIDVVSLAEEKNSSTKFLVPVDKRTTRRFDSAGHEKIPEKVVRTGMNAASSLKPQSLSPDYSDTQMMLEETQCSLPKSTILPVIVIRKINNSLVCQPQQAKLPVTNFTPKLYEMNISIPEKMAGRQSDAKNTKVSPRPTLSCSPIRSYKTVMNLNEISGELECFHGNQSLSNKRHSQELSGSDDDTVSPDKKYKPTNNDIQSHVKSANVSPHSIEAPSPIRSYRTVINLNEITGELEYLHRNQIQTNKQDGQELFGSDSDMSQQKKYKPRNKENLVSLHKNTEKCVKTTLNSRPNVHTKHFMTNHKDNWNSSQKSRGTKVVTTALAFSTGNRNHSENCTNNGGNLTQILLEDTQELMDESLKQTTSFQTNRTLQPPFSARNAPDPSIVKITQLRSTPMEISCFPSKTNKKISKSSPQPKASSLKVYARARKSPTVSVIPQLKLKYEVNSKKNQRKVCIDLPIEPDNNHSFYETQDVEMSNAENLPPSPLLLKSDYRMKSSRILQPVVNFSNDVMTRKPEDLPIVIAKTRKLSNINVGMETQMLLDETQNDQVMLADESVKHSKHRNSPVSNSKISTDMQNKSECEKVRNSPAKPTVTAESHADIRANAGQMKAAVSMDVDNETNVNKPKSYLFVQSKKTFAPTKSRAFIDREREEERRLIMGIKSVYIHSPNEWVPHTKEMADFWKMPFDKIPEEIQKDLEDSD